ncbi:hemerythrin domain-containing protein [Sandaracinus amylolyticus]|uniref:Hemerythrin-like domain-containing protein n=1 Tax=Sandaracinus amylolyticus TaxID=927083 RepID=A0A0F6YFL5_9BACT|nr:hemerythrin domain-containing protein [Sandaracinus amylolyticus]AKF03835.1 hypothetical protein DB32_000984 [Sandaracinus amylolyticus]
MQQTIIHRQQHDHDELELLIERYERAPAARRPDTFRHIVKLVTTHAFAEEEVLFPTARGLGGPGELITAEIESEHQRINELFVEMESAHPGEPEFERRAIELFGLLRKDVADEENRLLPFLASALSTRELQRVGKLWAAAKKTAPNRAHPRIPRRPPGNVLAGLPLAIVDRVRDLFARWRHAPQ